MSWRRCSACRSASCSHRPSWPPGCPALAAGDHLAAQEHLQAPSLAELTPRRALERQLLLAAAAIERDDRMTASAVGGILQAARGGGFVNTVVTTAPQVTGYLIEHAPQLRPDPFTRQLITAALD